MNQPTMADVARHLGVSRQLVSIVLRDMPGASSETRKRVQAAARELGYSPHMGARTLRQTRSSYIGVVFAPAHGTDPDIVGSIYTAAAAHSYQVVLSAQTRTRTTSQAVDELQSYRCAAIVLIGADLTQSATRSLAQRVKVPLVVVGPAGKGRSRIFDTVRSAGDVGTGLAVRHLIALGHRQIAYVHAPAMPPAAPRLEGYLAAISQAGLEPDVVLLQGLDYTEEAGADAGRRLCDRPALPTAVIAGNDQQAVGTLQVLSRAGVSIPAEVSLVGFDNSRFAALSSIDLTTLQQDPDRMGAAAVQAAVRRIDEPTVPPSHLVVEPSLVVRSSTGPPRLD